MGKGRWVFPGQEIALVQAGRDEGGDWWGLTR